MSKNAKSEKNSKPVKVETAPTEKHSGWTYRLSRKQVKIMMANAKTPAERKILASLMPEPQRKY